MSAKITHNICVKTGTYQKDGETKPNWLVVGNRWEKEDGGVFFTMKRSFNPAGAMFEEGRDSIILSMFEVKEKEENKSSTENL